MSAWMIRMSSLLLALALVGCATVRTEGGVPIDTRYTAKGQDSRVMYLIIHYTVANFPLSVKILTEREVSAHYLLSDESPPLIYRLVDESRRAWHSGRSGWMNDRRLNASSIGIEIVHPGFILGPDKERIYQPFPQAQIEALIVLVKDIVARHQIRPERILGHGEVSPSYKEDPGPTFPWKLFADLGITPAWPDAARVAAQRALFEAELPDAAWFQAALAKHGYPIERSGVWDEQSRRVLMNFQMRYRPSAHEQMSLGYFAHPPRGADDVFRRPGGAFSGQPDAESAALLQVLTSPLKAPAGGDLDG